MFGAQGAFLPNSLVLAIVILASHWQGKFLPYCRRDRATGWFCNHFLGDPPNDPSGIAAWMPIAIYLSLLPLVRLLRLSLLQKHAIVILISCRR